MAFSVEQPGQVNRITYPLRVPGISGFMEFFIIAVLMLIGVLSGVKYTLISCSIHADKKGFAGNDEWTHPRQGAFLFAKTGCYGNNLGVHWVKHDGWGNPALGMYT